MCQLNAGACRVMQEVGVRGGTDITGFGLLGHGMELAQASKVGLTIYAEKAPLLSQAKEMASIGPGARGQQAQPEIRGRGATYCGQSGPGSLGSTGRRPDFGRHPDGSCT